MIKSLRFEMPKLQPRDWATLAALLVAVIFAFYYVLAYAWTEWFAPSSYYQHGIFVPFLVGYMVYRKREEIRNTELAPSAWGLVLIVLSIVLVWRGSSVSSQFLGQLGFMLFVFGGIIYVAGKRMARVLLMPTLLLGFMLPLPELVFMQLTNTGQVYSTKIAVKILEFLGYGPTMVSTSEIHLDHYVLNVGIPCSGFKLTMALLLFAVFFSYIARFNWWRVIVMFVTLIPVALIVNSMRVAAIGIFGENFGDEAGRMFHDYGSYLELVLAYAALFGLARWLGWKE